jgi:hypothetical protein
MTRGTGLILLSIVTLLVGCSSTPDNREAASNSVSAAPARVVCDSYLMQDMCVQDLSGDATVDLVYFTDTNEVFMYQEGRKETVEQVMPLHRCAVPLNPGMQATTNQILHRKNLSLTEELDITRKLIVNFVAAKPDIDACNARYEQENPQVAYDEEFSEDDFDWGED